MKFHSIISSYDRTAFFHVQFSILQSAYKFWATVKPGLDGAWLGSFYVITDVIDKESYSNAPCKRPGAAQRVIGGTRLVGSPKKRFFHDPQRDSARAAFAATRRLQSTRQGSLVQACNHLGLVFVFCCSQIVFSVPICWQVTSRHWTSHAPSNPGFTVSRM
jgi:hypothetical protein